MKPFKQLPIRQWQKAVHDNAMVHGWYDTERKAPELLCLLHSEVSEALEAYRDGDEAQFAEELADVAIRLLDMAEFFEIDLEHWIHRKHEFNKSRPYRHGNKRC